MVKMSHHNPASMLRIFEDLDRYAIGFDSLFDRFTTTYSPVTNYPPHNISKMEDNRYRIEMALAGYSRDNLEVYTQQDVLFVVAKKEDVDSTKYTHKGIARRSFTWSRILPENLHVEAVEFKDGLLTIELKKEVPEPAPKKVYL